MCCDRTMEQHAAPCEVPFIWLLGGDSAIEWDKRLRVKFDSFGYWVAIVPSVK